MSQAALSLARFDSFESPTRSRPRPAPPLVARLAPRLAPQRELLLRRRWIVGGYGRPMPRPRAVDELPTGRRLLRPYELRLDQIIPDTPTDVYELRDEQILHD